MLIEEIVEYIGPSWPNGTYFRNFQQNDTIHK